MKLFPIALGCMGMSRMYGHADDNESIATIHAALDHGINLIDTGDFYGTGHNEMLIGRALHGRQAQVMLSVKFGALRGPGGEWLGIDTRPVAVKNFVAQSRNSELMTALIVKSLGHSQSCTISFTPLLPRTPLIIC